MYQEFTEGHTASVTLQTKLTLSPVMWNTLDIDTTYCHVWLKLRLWVAFRATASVPYKFHSWINSAHSTSSLNTSCCYTYSYIKLNWLPDPKEPMKRLPKSAKVSKSLHIWMTQKLQQFKSYNFRHLEGRPTTDADTRNCNFSTLFSHSCLQDRLRLWL